MGNLLHNLTVVPMLFVYLLEEMSKLDAALSLLYESIGLL